jgi:SAM-dependent methyltransferase
MIGLKDVTVTGTPDGPLPVTTELSLPPTAGGYFFRCPNHLFDIEEDFPLPDAAFDIAILTDVLEHIMRDPMHTLNEVNRITKPGGWLILSTPNCASLRSTFASIRGHHPYIWAQYSSNAHRDRHNREYTAAEVGRLLQFTGYNVSRSSLLQTTLTHHPAQLMSMLRKRLPASLLQALAQSLAITCHHRFAVSVRLPWRKNPDR